MANRNIGVHVTGIPELSRALKALDKDAYKQLRLAMKAISQHVIGTAVARGAPGGVLKPRATQKGAGIAYPAGGKGSGQDAFGYYPWLDWGGGDPRKRGVTALAPEGSRRAKVDDGRYLYPAVAESQDFIASEAYEAITTAARTNGFEVKG